MQSSGLGGSLTFHAYTCRWGCLNMFHPDILPHLLWQTVRYENHGQVSSMIYTCKKEAGFRCVKSSEWPLWDPCRFHDILHTTRLDRNLQSSSLASPIWSSEIAPHRGSYDDLSQIVATSRLLRHPVGTPWGLTAGLMTVKSWWRVMVDSTLW